MIYEEEKWKTHKIREAERDLRHNQEPKRGKIWREKWDIQGRTGTETYNRISKKAPFYKAMFRWNRRVGSSLGLPSSVIAGLNRDTIFSQRETIFSLMLFARCEGCCNLAPRLGRNTVPQLGHQKASVHYNAKEIIPRFRLLKGRPGEVESKSVGWKKKWQEMTKGKGGVERLKKRVKRDKDKGDKKETRADKRRCRETKKWGAKERGRL